MLHIRSAKNRLISGHILWPKFHPAFADVISHSFLRCQPGGLILSSTVWAATFTVNHSGDAGDSNPGDGLCATAGGVCTLRAAIQEANALAGADTIQFQIGTGSVTISPQSAYPDIVDEVSILGTTQPGSSPNTKAVGNDAVINLRIDGAAAGSSPGLRFIGGASNSVLRGVCITRFANGGAVLWGALSNVTIAGNFIGTDGSGSVADLDGSLGTGVAVLIGNGVTDSLVGGDLPADRNLLVGGYGISVGVRVTDGTTNNISVRGNYIGVDRAGTRPGTTGWGIHFTENTSGNHALRNVVGGSYGGVRIGRGAQGNRVQGNFIGVGADAATKVVGVPTSVLQYGVRISDENTSFNPQRNQIGGVNATDGNAIAYWSGDGVRLERQSATSPPVRYNAIQGNRIYANGGLGIELVDVSAGQGAGVSSPAPLAINSGMRFPVISSAFNDAANGTSVGYSFTGAPSASYDMEFFANSQCDSSDHGEGQIFLGRASISTDGAGSYAGTATGLVGVPAGRFITMTATAVQGATTRDTSEFSQCFQLVTSSLIGTPPVFNSLPSINLQVGQFFNFYLSPFVTPTDGDPVLTFAFAAPPLFGRVSFNGTNGIFAGVPTAPGTYTYSLTASDRDGVSNPQQITFHVVPAGGPVSSPPILGDVPNASIAVGAPWNLALAGFVVATDGDPILSYNLVGGLPPGASFDSVTGNFSGSPAAGVYNFSVTASDKDGPSNPDMFTLTVIGGGVVQPTAIPALGPGGLALLSMLMAGVGMVRRRRA